MTINLNLPLELENALSAEATELNLPLSEYIVRLLTTRQALSNPPKTGAELVAYWKTARVINSRPTITDSSEGPEVELLIQPPHVASPPISDPETKRHFLEALVDRMQQNPIPPNAPRFTRDMLHERR